MWNQLLTQLLNAKCRKGAAGFLKIQIRTCGTFDIGFTCLLVPDHCCLPLVGDAHGHELVGEARRFELPVDGGDALENNNKNKFFSISRKIKHTITTHVLHGWDEHLGVLLRPALLGVARLELLLRLRDDLGLVAGVEHQEAGRGRALVK